MWKSEHLCSIPSSSTYTLCDFREITSVSSFIPCKCIAFLLTNLGLGVEKSVVHAMKGKCRALENTCGGWGAANKSGRVSHRGLSGGNDLG